MCDVCERGLPCRPAASSIGPFTVCYCDECLRNHAEPVWAIDFIYGQCGKDWKNANQEIMSRVKFFRNGIYIPAMDYM